MEKTSGYIWRVLVTQQRVLNFAGRLSSFGRQCGNFGVNEAAVWGVIGAVFGMRTMVSMVVVRLKELEM